jgi:hypothetical protein
VFRCMNIFVCSNKNVYSFRFTFDDPSQTGDSCVAFFLYWL